MLRSGGHFARVGPALVLGAILAFHPNLTAQTHVVSPAEIQKAALDTTRVRQNNLKTLNEFLSSPQAKKGFQSTHLDPKQVKTAVAGLSDEELSQLASRAEKAQADFAAGRMDNHDLLIIVIAILALILIIVAVRH